MRPHPQFPPGGAIRASYFLPFILLIASFDAFAWNKPGHMVTAGVAFDSLRGHDDDVIKKVTALLQHHPFYEPQWKSQIRALSAEDQALVLFMLASAWPDDVRMDRRFHQGAWHFANFPYVPKGQPRHIRGRDPDPDNILSAFSHNVKIVQNKARPDAERAVALAWIFHLVGDVHQPLHTVSLFTVQWPNGDRGGNDFIIRAKAENQPIDLHRFWDDLIIGSDRLRSIRNASILIRKTFPRDHLRELQHREFREWSAESFQLAQSHVYQFGKLPGSVDKNNAPVLTQSYRMNAKALAERRAALAGYRLADVLEQLFD
ncbi:MAG: S1/P1 nuclease [Candidatus Hydrogenedentes bacterium]|nr:S1/P1 nuclease [Candidatus Hydrogenedentota bacterium]